MRLDDPACVARQYETEKGLAARKALYSEVGGADARELAFDAVREPSPAAVLEVGCGEGELAARIEEELHVDVVAIDQSPRMVELARARGVDACVADVQDLPFDNDSFDVALAAWVLFHVPDLDRGLGELSRVLRPGGRLIAVTNFADHLIEMFEVAGATRFDLSFDGENGAELLGRHFDCVEARDASGTVTLRDAEAVRSYFRSSELLAAHAARVPDLTEPFVARRHQAVFIAEKAA